MYVNSRPVPSISGKENGENGGGRKKRQVPFGLISIILMVMEEQKLIQARQQNKTQSNRYYPVKNKGRESKILQKLMENHN